MELHRHHANQTRFKDIGLAHILGTPEVLEGTQLIHRVECPLTARRRETEARLAQHTPSPTFRQAFR